MNRTDSIIGFALFIFMGFICFLMAGFYAPFILLKARKFCLLFTLGSVFWVSSFTFLYGPKKHFQSFFSKEKAIFSATYFGSLLFTLYAALVLKLTLLTIVAALTQVGALGWYIFSYIPGGAAGLWMFSRGFKTLSSQTLPV